MEEHETGRDDIFECIRKRGFRECCASAVRVAHIEQTLLTNALFSGLSDSKILCGPGGAIGPP
jgi:hypothetical protein